MHRVSRGGVGVSSIGWDGGTRDGGDGGVVRVQIGYFFHFLKGKNIILHNSICSCRGLTAEKIRGRGVMRKKLARFSEKSQKLM